MKADVGWTIAGDAGKATALISVDAAKTADTVLEVSSALCLSAGVVRPDMMFTVHSVLAFSVAVAAISATVAVEVPEFDTAAVKVVVPQPKVYGAEGAEREK